MGEQEEYFSYIVEVKVPRECSVYVTGLNPGIFGCSLLPLVGFLW